MVFYNGFNLLVDLVIAAAVFAATYYQCKNHFYAKGMIETLEGIDDGSLFQSEKGWVIPCTDGGYMTIDTGARTYGSDTN